MFGNKINWKNLFRLFQKTSEDTLLGVKLKPGMVIEINLFDERRWYLILIKCGKLVVTDWHTGEDFYSLNKDLVSAFKNRTTAIYPDTFSAINKINHLYKKS